jgi:hypothetical protein
MLRVRFAAVTLARWDRGYAGCWIRTSEKTSTRHLGG